MFYEAKDHHGLKHDPLKCLIAPRPIGWISTLDQEGRPNLAPFSFFNGVSTDPPVIMFSAGGQHAEGGFKDSAANAEATGEFVFNLATWDTREQMNLTSADAPRGWDEFKIAGLTPAPSRLVKAPRVKESPAHLECRYRQTLEIPSSIPGNPNKVVFGDVVGIHIDDDMIKDGMVDQGALRAIARLGYMDYTVVETIFTMQRPLMADLTEPA